MRQVLRIAREEWRYWRRTRLAAAAIAVALLVTVVSVASTAWEVSSATSQRQALQYAAETAFKSQPARHPHRMVHYGHYVFRKPAPLAVVDPGVDTHAGTAMFLEGHRQNSATFSPLFTAAQAGPMASLPPARAYQLLVPLLLIIVAFNSMTRERAARTDRLLMLSDTTPRAILAGKTLALTGLAVLLLVPLAVGVTLAATAGESVLAGLGLWLGYALYLLIWVALTVAISARAENGPNALAALFAIWLGVCVVVPGAATQVVEAITPAHGKIENDLDVDVALRDSGDGHNADDPAFEKLRANLLAQYDVTAVEDLPINFRGVVAQAAEASQTDIMNRFAEAHRSAELEQAGVARLAGWFSPKMALRTYSMVVAATDLQQHHRFLAAAETTRFEFVQALNRLHAESLAYADDMARSRDPEAERRTRVSAENWQRLRSFEMEPPDATARLQGATPQLAMMSLWLLGAMAALADASRRMMRQDD